MSGELVVLRILHIVAGVSWVGTAVFMSVVLEPILRGAGPDVMKVIGPKLAPRMTAFLHSVALTTIVAGLILIWRTTGRGYDQLFSNAWGWAIGIGMITAIVGYGFGATSGMAMMKVLKISNGLQGPPPPETIARINALRDRNRNFLRIATILVIIGVGAMASARYV